MMSDRNRLLLVRASELSDGQTQAPMIFADQYFVIIMRAVCLIKTLKQTFCSSARITDDVSIR